MVINEILTLLKWCILAASTVGPGHILTFTLAGAKYEVALMWAVLASAAVAFIMQECVARLCIVSGRSFGEAMKFHFGKGGKEHIWARISTITVSAIVISNMAYGCSTLTGFHSAMTTLGYPDTALYRVICHACFVTAVGTAVLFANVTTIASFLGIIVLALTGSFAYATAQGDFDWSNSDLLKGTLVPTFPAGSEAAALAMMGSTGSPFILFLSSSVQSEESMEVL